MSWLEQSRNLVSNIGKLGGKKIAILAFVGIAVFLLIAVSSMYLTRPQFETLYTGLDSQDVAAIGTVLKETDIDFDVSEDAKTIKVQYGQTSRARMLLAEKNLPRSAKAGYELFDNMGSLGLTSFMQQVTLVRALEGEVARTIQLLQGVKAARVHIVMPKNGSFRRNSTKPSASIVIRTDSSYSMSSAEAVRHLVAAAVPGLDIDAVTVMNTDGSLLASGDDKQSLAPARLVSLEMAAGKQIKENINSTLTPYLGIGNFQVSVAVRLNTDKRSIKETTYDPASRVERSIREIKEKGSAENSSSTASASIEKEIPATGSDTPGGKKNSENKERKEKLINYEISSKTVATQGDGYLVKKISIAAVVNRKVFESTIDGKPTPQILEKQKDELKQLISTAAGLDKTRGDKIDVTLVNFMSGSSQLEPVEPPGLMSHLYRLIPGVFNGFVILAVTLLVIFLGIRPATRALVQIDNQPDEAGGLPELENLGSPAALESLDSLASSGEMDSLASLDGGGEMMSPLNMAMEPEENLIEDVTGQVSQVPMKRLEQMIEFDEEKAANALKKWVYEESPA